MDSNDRSDSSAQNESGWELNDPGLELGIREKNPEALATFLDQHREQLGRFIRSITGEHLLSVVEIDDLVQEVSAAAIAGLKTAPLEQYAPMQWLQEIARRRVVDAHRFHFDAKRRDANRKQSIHGGGAGSGDTSGGLEALLAVSMTSPSAAVSRDIRLVRMNAAISTLSDEQQTAIRLRYAEGLPTKQIAEQLGKTDVATRVLLSRSMRELEKQLEDVRPTR